MTAVKGWGRVTWDGCTLSLDCAGSQIPPGYQLRSIMPLDLDTRGLSPGEVLEYEIVPSPGPEAAELRRRFPFEPKAGDMRS